MGKDARRPVIGPDEPQALLGVEPLHGAVCHTAAFPRAAFAALHGRCRAPGASEPPADPWSTSLSERPDLRRAAARPRPHTRFELEPVAGADGLYRMCPLDDLDLRLFLLDAAVYEAAGRASRDVLDGQVYLVRAIVGAFE